MNTQTRHGFECVTCGETFEDGIVAGNHEMDNPGHRVTNADVVYGDGNEVRQA